MPGRFCWFLPLTHVAGWYILIGMKRIRRARHLHLWGLVPASCAAAGVLVAGFLVRVAPAAAERTLSWGECLREAQRNNPDLISAAEDIAQADADTALAQSRFLPQLSAQLGLSTSVETDAKTSKNYSYGVNASQLVFDGLKTSAQLQKARHTGAAARQAFRYASSQVRYQLRAAFIGLLKAQESVRVAEEIYQLRRGDLVLITLRYESGLEHRGALLSAEANVAQATLEKERARRDQEVAQRQLLRQIGEAVFAPVQVEGAWEVVVAAEPPDLEKIAENNPALLEAVSRKNAAVYGLKAARGDFLPALTGQGSVGRSSRVWPPRTNAWGAGLELSWPLFEGGAKTAELSRAYALLRQTDSRQRATQQDVILALAEGWASLQDQISTVQVQHKFLAAAQERARIAEAQYSLGLIKYDTWTIIQDELVRAKKNVLEAQANALLAEAAWVQAKGETLEYAN